MWYLTTSGLSTQVYYRERCTLGDLKGQSFNTGGLKDRLNCIMEWHGLFYLHFSLSFPSKPLNVSARLGRGGGGPWFVLSSPTLVALRYRLVVVRTTGGTTSVFIRLNRRVAERIDSSSSMPGIFWGSKCLHIFHVLKLQKNRNFYPV